MDEFRLHLWYDLLIDYFFLSEFFFNSSFLSRPDNTTRAPKRNSKQSI